MVKSHLLFLIFILLASIMYLIIWGNSYLFFAKITPVVFSGLRSTLQHDFLWPISMYHKHRGNKK